MKEKALLVIFLCIVGAGACWFSYKHGPYPINLEFLNSEEESPGWTPPNSSPSPSPPDQPMRPIPGWKPQQEAPRQEEPQPKPQYRQPQQPQQPNCPG